MKQNIMKQQLIDANNNVKLKWKCVFTFIYVNQFLWISLNNHSLCHILPNPRKCESSFTKKGFHYERVKSECRRGRQRRRHMVRWSGSKDCRTIQPTKLVERGTFVRRQKIVKENNTKIKKHGVKKAVKNVSEYNKQWLIHGTEELQYSSKRRGYHETIVTAFLLL